MTRRPPPLPFPTSLIATTKSRRRAHDRGREEGSSRTPLVPRRGTSSDPARCFEPARGGLLAGEHPCESLVWPSDRAAGIPWLRKKLSEKLHLDLEKLAPDALVFHLDSSYGADITAVCRGVELTE